MSEPGIPVLESLCVFADGKVALEYPLAVYRPDEFLAGRSVRVILITRIEGSLLGCVPQLAWDRLVAKRILPRSFLTKAVRVLVKNCREDDRSSVGESDSVVWLGFVSADMEAMLEPSTMEDETVEVDSGEDQLPYAEALMQVAQDHFAFFSAEEEAAPPEVQDPGSASLAERMHHMEIMMQNLSAHMAALVPTTPKVNYMEKPPAAAASVLPTAKGKQRQHRQPSEDAEEEKYPDLDPGVVAAAVSSWNRTRCLGGDAGADVKESEGCESLEEGQDSSAWERPTLRDGRGRGRRAWISRWLLRSRYLCFAETHRDCWGAAERQEEEVWKFQVGNCLGWSFGGSWWRVIILPWRQEVGNGEEDLADYTSRCPGGDLQPDRAANGRRCAFSHAPTGAGSSHLHGPRMGRTSVEDRTVQGSCPLGVGRVRYIGPTTERETRLAREHVVVFFFYDWISLRWTVEVGVSPQTFRWRLCRPSARYLNTRLPTWRMEIFHSHDYWTPRWAELALSHLKDQEDYVSRRRNLGKKSQVDQEDGGAASPKKAPKYKAKAKAAAAAEDQ